MRLRLLRRRLTVMAPRVAIRSTLPWPVRWLFAAMMLGICATVGLWTFELGRDIAGLDRSTHDELAALRSDAAQLRAERDRLQRDASAAGSLLTAQQATQDRLLVQIRQLESDNRSLRDDLGFFEALIPSSGSADVAIRGLQAEVLDGGQLRWQVLVMQPVKNAPEFKGRLELTVAGTQDGQPWSMALPGGPQPMHLRQYRRLEGVFGLPARAVVKNVSVRVMDGAAVRATQSLAL
ncbi:hypothetical protein PY257_14955 [Ramlibacter sp. H39-3-26]|uniref:DUF6776 family protein n=1 Tax=Curvibacter soli TaxID=3031331 RepID=UPI0023DA9A11|nr:DUF6776 family protein [Ramlibacter sp. H39-3-26]MDF1486462.1 hypothetical protein [Ramlibacter sp. H39-3-26]